MRKKFGPEFPPTLPALLLGRDRDASPAVTDESGTLDWAGFRNRVLETAAGLRRAGVGPGTRVALWLPNGIFYLAAIFGCARLGALAIHINTRFRAAEVGSLLSRSRASVLITDFAFSAVDFPGIFAALPAAARTAVQTAVGLNIGRRAAELAGVPVLPISGPAEAAGPDEARGDTPCLTFTTSGTTSGPKLVLHDQAAIAGHAANVARAIGLDAPGAAALAAVPMCGTFGNAFAMAAVAGGAHVVCQAQFDPVQAAALIRQHRVSHLIGGDDMLGRIAAASGGCPFGSMRHSGFAPFQSNAAANIAAAAAAGLHPCGLYGSSEVQALFSFSEGDERLSNGGVPISRDARISVRDPQSGAELPPGGSGELWIDAPSRFVEYLEDEAATSKAITADGWFRTGDLARLSGRGFVYEARIGDAMRLGGFLVAPEEIEAFLQAQPGVAAVQVVAGSAAATEDPVPVAFIQPTEGAAVDEAALLALCREQLARFKVPKRILVLQAFPTVDSPNGPKIQRARLREMAEAALREHAVGSPP